jgi:NB-ARC domain
VETLKNCPNIDLSSNVSRSSIVDIDASNQNGIGFFVTIDMILTCSSVLKNTPKESIYIHQGIEKYEVIDYNIREDIAIIRIAVNEDKKPMYLDLDMGDKLDEDFYIFQSEAGEHGSTPVKVLNTAQRYLQKTLVFTGDGIEGESSGSPLINAQTNRVSGIVSLHLHSPKAFLNSKKATTGYAISTSVIFSSYPKLKKFHQNSNPILCNLSKATYTKFIGRETELKLLSDYISPQYRQHIIVIEGDPGVGKTALALKIAHRCYQQQQSYFTPPSTSDFKAIVFVSLKNNKLFPKYFSSLLGNSFSNINLLLILRTIANTLKVPELNQFHKNDKLDIIYRKLAEQATLLIVDGIDDVGSSESNKIFEFLNDLPASTKVIITTRQKALSYSHISLEPFSKKDSNKFILEQVKDKNVSIPATDAENIADAARGIPIALTYAVGLYMNGYNFDNVANSSDTDAGEICFKNLLKSLSGSPTYHLLFILSFFPNEVSKSVLLSVTELNHPLDNILEELIKISLVSKNVINAEEVYYSILPITREYAASAVEQLSNKQSRLLSAARSRWVDWYKAFVQDYGKNSNDEFYKRGLNRELENIGEVLLWCAVQEDYETIKEIWDTIDPFIAEKGYWVIRFFWWQYLEKESRKRADFSFYVKALLEKAFTWLAMDKHHCEEAKSCIDEASKFNRYADTKVQDKLQVYTELWSNSCGGVSLMR